MSHFKLTEEEIKIQLNKYLYNVLYIDIHVCGCICIYIYECINHKGPISKTFQLLKV